MFEKTATDLIREIRSKKFSIQSTLNDIQSEITRSETRGSAIQKCCVLHLLGYDLQSMSFHVIECMSSHKQSEKRIGYAAAALCFSQETPMLMLCTNLIKKDLKSNIGDGAMALHTLSQIADRDLARDLHHDVVMLLNHSNAYIRKRAVITIYRLFLKYPDAIGTSFPRLKERLEDEDTSVVCATISVFCEMAHENPKSLLILVPQLFGLLLSLNHNWSLIKIVKIFGWLSPHEPRLAKKLVKPLQTLLSKTRAMSLVYEVVHTIITGGMIKNEEDEKEIDQSENTNELFVVCLEKLLLFLDQSDQNLKFLGLDSLGKLLKRRPSTGLKHRDIILKCLEDGDISIRNRALELVTTLVNEKSLFSIVKKLILHLTSSIFSLSLSPQEKNYRSKVVSTILDQCSKNNYVNLTSFDWYISVLCDLATFGGLNKAIGKKLRDQLIEVCVRVPEVRPHAVDQLIPLLNDEKIIASSSLPNNLCEFLYGAAWVCGEYAESRLEEIFPKLISSKLSTLSPSIQAVYLFAFLKLSSRFAEKALQVVDPMAFACFIRALDFNLQERASIIQEIWLENKLHGDSSNPWTEKVPWSNEVLADIFGKSFNMVAPNAQEKLPVELDLDSWLVPIQPDDVKLDESLNTTLVESDKNLTDNRMEEAGSTKEEAINNLNPSKVTPTSGSSVMQKPSLTKKYSLNTKYDGEELVETSKQKKKSSKHHLPKEFRFRVPEIRTCSFMLGEKESFKIMASYKHDFKDPLVTELVINLTISTEPSYPITLLVQSIQLPSNEIRCVSKRSNTESFFHTNSEFQVQLGKDLFNINLHLPFSINVLHPKFNRKMTHDQFLAILLNPPHLLDKIIKITTKETSIATVTQDTALEMLCVYQLLEEAGSLLGMTVKKIVFVGLVKIENGVVVIEIKTKNDLELVHWIESLLNKYD